MVKYKKKIGTRLEVMNGIAKMTGGGLTKRQLKYNKKGKIVSIKASNSAKKKNNLIKGGYKKQHGGRCVKILSQGTNNSSLKITKTRTKTRTKIVNRESVLDTILRSIKSIDGTLTGLYSQETPEDILNTILFNPIELYNEINEQYNYIKKNRIKRNIDLKKTIFKKPNINIKNLLNHIMCNTNSFLYEYGKIIYELLYLNRNNENNDITSEINNDYILAVRKDVIKYNFKYIKKIIILFLLYGLLPNLIMKENRFMNELYNDIKKQNDTLKKLPNIKKELDTKVAAGGNNTIYIIKINNNYYLIRYEHMFNIKKPKKRKNNEHLNIKLKIYELFENKLQFYKFLIKFKIQKIKLKTVPFPDYV